MRAYCFFQSKPAVNFDKGGRSLTDSSPFGNSSNLFSKKCIRRPRPWSPDTMFAFESRLFNPRLSRTLVYIFLVFYVLCKDWAVMGCTFWCGGGKVVYLW